MAVGTLMWLIEGREDDGRRGRLKGRILIANQKPPTLHQMHQAISLIQASLKSSQPVVVHCEAGLGRTGTIIAGYLTTCGLPAQEAIDSLRKVRPGSVETEEQEAVIYEYARIHRALLEGSDSQEQQ